MVIHNTQYCIYLWIQYKKEAFYLPERQIDKQNCEMKRLYVRSEFRGNHIGDVLMKQIIDDAKEIGY